MSAENVELIRSVLPGPEVDLVVLYSDDAAMEQNLDLVRSLYGGWGRRTGAVHEHLCQLRQTFISTATHP